MRARLGRPDSFAKRWRQTGWLHQWFSSRDFTRHDGEKLKLREL
ncbi:hypothetical protein RMSM_06322 [Rhodopirellula maiorica SM1]|uniref:Uncharacterized protein n=1 Tax=Rhodopirellula maiorica SM1 TaxID=1265738 RepID=M5RB96_9BACT|nr:hypothetical protein RMSM_06322 [Rhodopirellula maiorica SM1]